MRLAAQIKGGFYPAPTSAIQMALDRIDLPAGDVAILDPCCGKAAALKQLHDALGGTAWGVELDEGRLAESRQTLPDASIIGPASFLSNVACTWRSFSLIWLNPPFDDELGGGRREELTFLRKATDLLVSGGVLAFVLPERVARQLPIQHFLMGNYEQFTLCPFPEDERPFDEVLILARRRKKPINHWESQERFGDYRYTLPASDGAKRWEKTGLTEAELATALAASPLRRLLSEHRTRGLTSPPLSLGKGHIALLLASGHLDGVVRPEGEPPHVVRGTVRKEQYVDRVEESESADGQRLRTTTIYSEKIVLSVRAVGTDGVVRTFE